MVRKFGGIDYEGAIVDDYTIPVAERIPDEVLTSIRNSGGALRVKFRLKPDGVMFGRGIGRALVEEAFSCSTCLAATSWKPGLSANLVAQMNNLYCRETLFAFSARWICAAGAWEEERQLEALTCSLDPGANLQAHRTWKDLGSRGRPVADGQFALEGRSIKGAVCVENVSVTGAFGVLIVAGEVCKDSSAEALSGFVLSKISDLKPADNGQIPGVISSYRSASRSILIFKGDPSPEPKPDASSSRVSYVCTHQSSGPQ